MSADFDRMADEAKAAHRKLGRSFRAHALVTKRVLDLVLAGAAVVILSPLLAVVCLGIKLEGRSPTILRRRHRAFNGHEFFIYEFTTTASEKEPDSQTRRHTTGVTRMGRLLQFTRMNELLLLFSVLRGHMSLVGPCPHEVGPEGRLSKVIAHHAIAVAIRPGITGWAQVNGLCHHTAPVEKMNQPAELEQWYSNNWSIRLDLHIMLRAFVLPARRNAN